MTRSEAVAFNRGVATMMQLAEQSADALAAKLVDKPTRYSFAVEAMQALAEASLALMIPIEDSAERVAAETTA